MSQVSCQNCAWMYPMDLVSTMRQSGAQPMLVCGICALDLSNALHGQNRKEFDGPMAEDLRQRAISWRAAHLEAAPTKGRIQ